MLAQGQTAGIGHAVALFATFGVALDHFAFFQKGQRWIDHAGAWAVGAIEHAFDLADQVVAMAGLFGDQGQQQQFQVAGGEYPWPATSTFAARALFEAVTAIAVLAVGGMMVSHCSFSLSCLDIT
ncbi:hypothetical protein EMIT0P253_60091 [Pseudomonas sp. IT-P253]